MDIVIESIALREWEAWYYAILYLIILPIGVYLVSR